MFYTLPLILTYARLLIVFIILAFYGLSPSSLALPKIAFLFALASFTDWLDGFLARKLNQITKFGAFLDPVADKILIASVMFILVDFFQEKLLTLLCSLIMIRELGMSALREWASEHRYSERVQVNSWGKWKTFFQQSALFALLLTASFGSVAELHFLGMLFLGIACFLSYYSFCLYFQAALKG